MDPLDVLDKLDQVFPHLQPVINAEEYRIIGYEVLGRVNNEDEIQSLAPFFLDRNVPAEYKWEVDKKIHDLAINLIADSDKKALLFFNFSSSTLLQLDIIEEIMERFTRFEEEKGIKKEQIVFEFRVDDLDAHIDDLSHILLYMKASGFKIALDNVKVTKMNLDLFSKIEPNIIKVDLSNLKEVVSHFTSRDALTSLALFSRKIGATLHFKGIEDFHQFHLAWKTGGRFFQGYYLKAPSNTCLPSESTRPFVEEKIHRFIDMQHKKLNEQIKFLSDLDHEMIKLLKEKESNEDKLLIKMAEAFKNKAFRIYICNIYGDQVSANYIRSENEWSYEDHAIGKNWSWRTYFLAQIMQMKHRKIGVLSDKYRDIETNDLIRTYSFPIQEDHYAFIDLDPIYLYDHDSLL